MVFDDSFCCIIRFLGLLVYLIGAVRIEAPKATDIDTEAEVKEWLTCAAERDGARKERNGSAEKCTSLICHVICILINYAVHDNFIFVFFIII